MPTLVFVSEISLPWRKLPPDAICRADTAAEAIGARTGLARDILDMAWLRHLWQSVEQVASGQVYRIAFGLALIGRDKHLVGEQPDFVAMSSDRHWTWSATKTR